MHTRLLTFFDECVVGGLLEQLGQLQGPLSPVSPAGEVKVRSVLNLVDICFTRRKCIKSSNGFNLS